MTPTRHDTLDSLAVVGVCALAFAAGFGSLVFGFRMLALYDDARFLFVIGAVWLSAFFIALVFYLSVRLEP